MTITIFHPDTFEEVVDTVEGGVVRYMATKRGMTEAQFRGLLFSTSPTSKPVLESYNRKVCRALITAKNHGVTPASFARLQLLNRSHGYSTSPDAGPQLPAAKKA